jgi:hypothetical protein
VFHNQRSDIITHLSFRFIPLVQDTQLDREQSMQYPMSAFGRDCVKTQNGVRSQNFGPPECAVFDYFWLGNGRMTPEIEMAMRFYTASAAKRPSS